MRTARPERPPSLWYDLSSLAQHDGSASGVQRVCAGLAIGLRSAPATRPIRFCRFDKSAGSSHWATTT